MGEKITKVSLCILVVLLMSMTTASQALLQNQQKQSVGFQILSRSRAGSIEIWEDEFFNQTKIDMAFSNNILINTTIGIISMESTYPAWTNPSFIRMKPINIINSGQETFQDYIIHLVVIKENDMQPDFDDLRFTDDTRNQLSYYTYNFQSANERTCEVLVEVPLVFQD